MKFPTSITTFLRRRVCNVCRELIDRQIQSWHANLLRRRTPQEQRNRMRISICGYIKAKVILKRRKPHQAARVQRRTWVTWFGWVVPHGLCQASLCWRGSDIFIETDPVVKSEVCWMGVGVLTEAVGGWSLWDKKETKSAGGSYTVTSSCFVAGSRSSPLSSKGSLDLERKFRRWLFKEVALPESASG